MTREMVEVVDRSDASAPGEATSPYADVLVIVPAYNEAGVIADVVADLRRTFPHVLVVDDGSTDETGTASRRAGARVARHLINLGQGGGLITGFRIAAQLPTFSWVVTFDADGQHAVSDAAAMVDHGREKQLDIVLGTRFGEGSSNASRGKRILLRLATWYTRLSTGLPVTDTHNGLRALTTDLAGRISIRDRGMGHASDILDYVATHDVKWEEIPVHIAYTEYSRAKGQSMTNAVNIVFDRWVR